MATLLLTNLKPNTIMVSFWKYGQHQRIEVPGYALNYELHINEELKEDFLKTVEENFSHCILTTKTKLDKALEKNEDLEDERLDAVNEQIDKDIQDNINRETMFLQSDDEDSLKVTVTNPYLASKGKSPKGRKPKAK